jgi:hypothetical protein
MLPTQPRLDVAGSLLPVGASRSSVTNGDHDRIPGARRHMPVGGLFWAEIFKKFPVIDLGDRFASDCAHHHFPVPQTADPSAKSGLAIPVERSKVHCTVLKYLMTTG